MGNDEKKRIWNHGMEKTIGGIARKLGFDYYSAATEKP
jgi:hypothetical protein